MIEAARREEWDAREVRVESAIVTASTPFSCWWLPLRMSGSRTPRTPARAIREGQGRKTRWFGPGSGGVRKNYRLSLRIARATGELLLESDDPTSRDAGKTGTSHGDLNQGSRALSFSQRLHYEIQGFECRKGDQLIAVVASNLKCGALKDKNIKLSEHYTSAIFRCKDDGD